jgi:hypothetical protein
MSLPILETPKYTVTIPSTKKSVEYRPYLVKEEKILMLAMESEDEKQMITAVKDIIRACTFEKLNPDDLTTVDLEYVFLKLRSKSVGEISTITLKCLNAECTGSVNAQIDLESIEPVSNGAAVSNRVQLTDKVGITLRPITVRILGRLDVDAKSKAEQVTALVISSIESIYDENGVYRAEDHTIEELSQFVDTLSTPHLQKIQAYVESLPRLTKDLEYTCPKCKVRHKITLSGLQSFFV